MGEEVLASRNLVLLCGRLTAPDSSGEEHDGLLEVESRSEVRQMPELRESERDLQQVGDLWALMVNHPNFPMMVLGMWCANSILALLSDLVLALDPPGQSRMSRWDSLLVFPFRELSLEMMMLEQWLVELSLVVALPGQPVLSNCSERILREPPALSRFPVESFSEARRGCFVVAQERKYQLVPRW